MSFTPEVQEEIRSFESPADALLWVDEKVAAVGTHPQQSHLTEEQLERSRDTYRFELLGEIAHIGEVWNQALVEEVLRVGSSNFGPWLAENPAVQGENVRPILAWCRRVFLTHYHIQNQWVGRQFFTTERGDAFRALAALAAREEIPRKHWLLRWARTEARLLPGNHYRREVLAAHPGDDPRDGWRAFEHAQHPHEEMRIRARILRLSSGAEYQRLWREVAEGDLKMAAKALDRASPEQIQALRPEDLFLLLTAEEPELRETALRASGHSEKIIPVPPAKKKRGSR